MLSYKYQFGCWVIVLWCRTQPWSEGGRRGRGCTAAAPSHGWHTQATPTARATTLHKEWYHSICAKVFKENQKPLKGFFFFLSLFIALISQHCLVPWFPSSVTDAASQQLFVWRLTNSRKGAAEPAGWLCHFMRKNSFISTVCSTIRGICLSHSEITICSGNSHMELNWRVSETQINN